MERLQGSSDEHIIKLFAHEQTSERLLMLMECGDADLATVLKTRKSQKKLDENHTRLYWQQMLEAVQIIHKAAIVHGDLKPANFLFVRGVLKLIDFGIATGVQVCCVFVKSFLFCLQT